MKGFIDEWKAIIADKKMLISILGIMIIPVLYGGLLLWAFWDPYGQVEELPVAIVNEDEGAEMDGEDIQAGDEFVEELLESQDFNWHVADVEEAQRGLEDLDYYFYAHIPATFSEDVASLQDDNPHSGMIHYDINEDYNFAGAQMGSQAISEIEEELSQTLTETYVEVADDAYSELVDAVTQLRDGSEEVAEGVISAIENMGSLNEGLRDLDDGAYELQAGASEAAEGTNELRTEVEDFVERYQNSDEISQLETTIGEMQEDVTAARTYLESEDAVQLEQSLTSLNEHWSEARTSLQSAEESLSALEERLEGHEQYVQEAQDVLHDIREINDQLNHWQNKAEERSSDLETFVGTCYDFQASVDDANEAEEQTESLSSYIAENYPEDEELQNYANSLEEAIEGVGSLDAQPCHQLDEIVTSLDQTIDDMDNSTTAVSEQIESMEEGFTQTINSISSSQEELSNWITEVHGDLENARNAAPEGIGEGEIELLEIFPQARTTLADLDQSLSQADEILATVDEQIVEVETAVQDLDEGIQELDEGTSELSAQMGNTLQGGMEIEEGLADLDDGALELEENLETLENTLRENQLNEDQQALFSSPVKTSADRDFNEYSYGEGLSPYFLSMALFVGGLTLSIIYPFYQPLTEHKTAWRWFSGKIGVVWSVAVAQSLALLGVVFFMLELELTNPGWFAFFMWFVSLSFLTLIFMLVSLLDNPGRFIAIILLIVQLGGSGGSFPVEVVAGPFQYVHPWLPMTYSVLGLRATTFMDEPSSLLETWPLLLILVLAFVVSMLFFFFRFKKSAAAE
ncbi:putative membrane protein [Geomicrobium halophilum]|uniref:Putative membrane protein n=1 Tax=Geomicrobium halophilum TaxID=549000 RepID=A0A841PX82_9BACL|nr:YhgE/Pip domain-containing protein [Geomicrobium halophilum]MBB6451241.1 putative membrane protein [Geomicrobium halophilum]